MKKKILLQNLPLVILAAAIAFSPSFSAGKIAGERVIEIRIEDILIVILGLVWITNFLISGKKRVKRPPLFLPILAWLGIGFFSVMTNWIFMHIETSRGFFYFLKEIEFFFLYFYLFYHIKDIGSAKFIINSWIILGVINIFIIAFQLIGGIGYGAYGPSMLMERGPLPSGGFFLILFANLFNVFLYYHSRLDISKIKKSILIFCILLLIIGVISSGSKTCIFGLALAVILSLFFYQLRRGGLKPFFIGLLTLFVVLGMFIAVSSKVPYVWGVKSPITALDPRIGIWKEQIRLFSDNSFNILFGMGKSVLLAGDESHSQYVRNFIETGIIGSLIFFILIFAIIKKAFQGFSSTKAPLLIGLSSGLLVSTFVMLFISIPAEGFLVVKPNEVYWFFTAITMAALSSKVKRN